MKNVSEIRRLSLDLKFKSIAASLAVVLCLATLLVPSSAAVTSGNRSFTSSYDKSARYYWLDLPDNFDSSALAPLVIFLHGYGQDRSCYRTYYPGLQQVFHQNGWIVACPECRTISSGGNTYWAWYTAQSRSDITDVINLLEQEFNIDRSHIHIMGTSMGGSGTLQYAMFNPDTIASACPVMGVTDFAAFYNWPQVDQTLKTSIKVTFGGTPTEKPLVYKDESPLGNEIRFAHTPVFLLHGSADTVVPVSNSQNLYNSLRQAGYVVKYDEVSGVGHYGTDLIGGREQKIYEWFRDHPLYTSTSPSTTITSTPAGTGFITVDGTAITTPQPFNWAIGESHTLSASSLVSETGVQYAYAGWSDGGGQTHSYTVQSTGTTLTASYRTQWQVSFAQSGLGSDATGTILTVGSSTYTSSQLPQTNIWVDDGTVYSYIPTVTSSVAGKHYVSTGVAGGLATPIKAPGTATGTYKTQYQLSFAVSPAGAGTTNPTGTGLWKDSGSLPISAAPNPGYSFSSWSSTGSITFTSTNSASTSATISGPGTITANFAPVAGTVWARTWYVYSGNSRNPWGQLLGSGPNESNLNFDKNWGSGTVAYSRSNRIGFVSTRTVNLSAGTWTFTVGGDDGVRLYIDNKLVINGWKNQAYTRYTYKTSFSSTADHSLRLEWYEYTGNARVSFSLTQG
jgi:poly(3-hydroxybutyrate) depolymerase